MKTFQMAIATITITGFGSVAADLVNPADVTTFESGTTALASEVNSTLQALITAVDDNAERLAAVETELARLEPVSVEGSTYCMYEIASGVGASDPSDPDPQNSDETWMGTFTGGGITELTFDTAQVTITGKMEASYEALAPTNRLLNASDPLESETATWTQVGNTVTVNFGGQDTIDLLVTPDNNVMLFIEAELDRSSDGSGYWFETALLVGTRATNCN
jgi:hypothetical protein